MKKIVLKSNTYLKAKVGIPFITLTQMDGHFRTEFFSSLIGPHLRYKVVFYIVILTIDQKDNS